MEERLQKELERDPSDIGKQSALACRSAWPSIEAKEAAWSRYTAEKPFATNHMMFAGINRVVLFPLDGYPATEI